MINRILTKRFGEERKNEILGAALYHTALFSLVGCVFGVPLVLLGWGFVWAWLRVCDGTGLALHVPSHGLRVALGALLYLVIAVPITVRIWNEVTEGAFGNGQRGNNQGAPTVILYLGMFAFAGCLGVGLLALLGWGFVWAWLRVCDGTGLSAAVPSHGGRVALGALLYLATVAVVGPRLWKEAGMTREGKDTRRAGKAARRRGGPSPVAPSPRPDADRPRVTLSTHPGVSDEVLGHLRAGWWLVLLGLTCAPPVFLPLAIYNGVQANAKGEEGQGRSIIATAVFIIVVYIGIVAAILLRPPSR